MQEEVRTEGVILRAAPYEERCQLLTVFTPRAGMVRLIGRQGGVSKMAPGLSLADLLYRKGRSDLMRLLEWSPLNLYPEMRLELPRLEAAWGMVGALLHLLLEGRPAPKLYALFTSYLSALGKIERPELLLASFRLKLLRHEGLISFGPHCSLCHKEAARGWLDGAPFCEEHGKGSRFLFSEEDWESIVHLAAARSFEQLSAVILSHSLQTRIHELVETMR